jgi:2-polyprenyl-3-methyl-5-hydroxy-6-metoxy-1,4-benzoquinol methylase
MASRLIDHENACRRVARRFPERWLRSYALRKLRTDPAFPAAYDWLCREEGPVTDLGCGVGLLPFYLRERNWQGSVTGVDCDGRKIGRARRAAEGNYADISFLEQAAADSVPSAGHIVLFDLLHYCAPNEQRNLLDRLAARLAPGCLVLIRDCPREPNRRYWLTHLAERFAQAVTWNLQTPLHFPTRAEIAAPFEEERFGRSLRPLWGRTPFNNHLFVFRRHATGVAPV